MSGPEYDPVTWKRIEETASRIEQLEFALSELKMEYEGIMMAEAVTFDNPEPWKASENWQRADKLLHDKDVSR